ncbi:prepilin-type N-terminal cleavage/methylation domain-containing protein [Patescibacteria group bacterium]|nr:prepilin-type N-terminal cleavage/methylation domain-containing protein [Patescibacteria group bacterium]
MNKKGFTLIELLVVIAIIGLLSTLSVLALNSARARSRDAKRITDIKQIQTAVEMYYNDAGVYPPTASVVNGSPIATGSNTYMTSVPKAPTPVDGAACVSASANEYVYTYTPSSGFGGSYTLRYCLGAATGGVPAGVNTATPAGITLTPQ